jgi:acetoin utilization protein AcuB
MLVKDWMSKTVITIEEDRSKMDAMDLLKKHGVHILPVVKAGKLVGIITREGLQKVSTTAVDDLEVHELLHHIAKTKVKGIMTPNPITIPFDYTVGEAGRILFDNKISGAPVVDHEGHMVGIITQTDLFGVFVSLTDAGEKGVQFAFMLEDQPGSLRGIEDIIRKYGCQVASVLRSYERVQEGYCKVFIRVHDIDRSRLPQLKEEVKQKTTLLFMVDHGENKREIYY